MEGKARFVFPVVITAIVLFNVSGVVTLFNIGWRNDFVIRWWSAFAIGWPIAASTAYLVTPFARSLTQRIVAAIENRPICDLHRISEAATPRLTRGQIHRRHRCAPWRD